MDILFTNVRQEDLPLIREIFQEHCSTPAQATLPEQKAEPKEDPVKAPAPEPAKVPAAVPAPRTPPKKKNFWQIPFNSKRNPKEYGRCMTACKKYKLPYPEAKILWERDHPPKKNEAGPAGSPAAQVQEPDPAQAQPVQINGNGDTVFEKGMKVKQIRQEQGRAKAYGICTVVGIKAGGLVKIHDQSGWPHVVSQDVLVPA
jgi:hypothetical protein